VSTNGRGAAVQIVAAAASARPVGEEQMQTMWWQQHLRAPVGEEQV